jgi:molybdopterin-containing oxidoreductase family iron-sulfur binding subunit
MATDRKAEAVPLAMPLRNPGLAMEAARDARRVVAGELSEKEFYGKYHEAYVGEFGFDRRQVRRPGSASGAGGGNVPNERGDGGQGDDPSGPITGEGISRRGFLMWVAGGVIATVLSSTLEIAYGATPIQEVGEEPRQNRRVQLGMVIDLENCTGCLACVDACKRENNLDEATHWMYVMAFRNPGEEEGQGEGRSPLYFLVRPCQHCSNPPCVKVCPTMARHNREKDGLVLTDYDICIGCRYCEVACPYGVNYFQWDEPKPQPKWMKAHLRDYRGRWVDLNPPRGVMGKCTFCPQRQDSEARRGTMACQQACPHDAIFVGDLNDPNSPPRRHLEEKRKEKGGRLSTFRLQEEMGTKPNIIYIGHQPPREAKQMDGPVTYEEYGWVDERRKVLEGPRPWLMRVFGG